MHKGRGRTDCSLLLKIVIDFTAFQDDHWFVPTGEALMRNQNTARRQNAHRPSSISSNENVHN